MSDHEHRFWSKVRIGDGCWEWTGSLKSSGYGQFWLRGRMLAAHRVAFEIAGGAIGLAQDVCHRCDNRRCVRPSHLFVGTRSENMLDASRKGRCWQQTSPEKQPRGERHGRARLSESDVRAIREGVAHGAAKGEVADRFGVTVSTVKSIASRRTWRHVA